ncbi:helix-turn-helix domain-containing protein [Streptomyces sp. NPDC002588]|uniref:helix-turn-helix domain-containing protein n=1 Tax=Streptomyces sp. NPDC002588 TaxID=3154419 RepID=UPI003317AC89
MTEQRDDFAARLDWLFKRVHPAGRGPYTYKEVEEAIREAVGPGGKGLTASAIQQLRTGGNANPKLSTVQLLADFFGVAPAYFFDDKEAEATQAQVDVVAALRDADVKSIALRASGLSSEGLRQIRGIIEHVRHLEGLPDDNASR